MRRQETEQVARCLLNIHGYAGCKRRFRVPYHLPFLGCLLAERPVVEGALGVLFQLLTAVNCLEPVADPCGVDIDGSPHLVVRVGRETLDDDPATRTQDSAQLVDIACGCDRHGSW